MGLYNDAATSENTLLVPQKIKVPIQLSTCRLRAKGNKNIRRNKNIKYKNKNIRGLISGSEDPLEKEIATHSIILAWEIPWTEEPGGVYSSCGCRELNMT